MSKSVNPEVVLLNAMLHSRMQQRGIENNQNKLLNEIKLKWEEKVDVNFEAQSSDISSLISQDVQILGSISPNITAEAHPALKTHKLNVILNKGLPKLLDNGQAIPSIFSGKLPFDNDVGDSLPTLGSGGYYGTGNPSYVSALLHYSALSLTLDPMIITGPHSAIYHKNPLANSFSEAAGNFTWYDAKDNALIVPHSGYAFGGHRNQKTDNPFAPEDCTSLIGKYTTPQITTTTADFMCTWNVNTGEFGSWRPAEWGPEILTSLYSPIRAQDAQTGDIYFHKLLKDSPEKIVYAGGHAAIAFSKNCQEVSTIGANRDLEREFSDNPKVGMEGIGFQSFPLQADGKFIGFLRPNDSLLKQIPDPFGINNQDWIHEPITELSVVQYYDSHYDHTGAHLTGMDTSSSAAVYD